LKEDIVLLIKKEEKKKLIQYHKDPLRSTGEGPIPGEGKKVDQAKKGKIAKKSQPITE